MGRIAALALAAGVAVALSGCGSGGSNSSNSEACSSVKALSNTKDRIDSADSRVLAVEKNAHTLADFPKIVAVEKKTLPTYREALREANRGRASTSDSDLKSGWAAMAKAAQVRIRGASFVIKTFSSSSITNAQVVAVSRISNQVDKQNALWTTVANRLNSRFASCSR